MDRMPKLVKILVGVLVFFVLLAGAVAFGLHSLVAGAGKEKLLALLGQSLGVRVQVEEIEVNLGRLAQLEPTLRLNCIRLGNPPGYGSETMVEAESLGAQVALGSVFSSNPKIVALDVQKPVLSIRWAEAVKDQSGKTNLEAFIDNLNAPEAGAPAQPAAATAVEPSRRLAIERLTLAGGAIRVAGQPLGSWGDITLDLRGFGSGGPLAAKLAARLRGSKASGVEFAGSLGPFGPSALPADGKLSLRFAPGQLPQDYLEHEFGNFLAAPGEKALLKLDVALKGDLNKTASGPAKLALSDFMIGRDEAHRLPLGGEAAGTLTVQHVLSSPASSVHIPKSSLTLASGRLDSALDLSLVHSHMQAALAGSLKGIDVEQFLSAFVESDSGIQGALNMPKFELKLAGKDSKQLQSSLSGSGSVLLEKGKLKQMDMLGSVMTALGKVGLMKATGSTEFTRLKTDFAIADRVLSLSGTELEGAGLSATGAGSVTFDTVMDFKVKAQVGGPIAGLFGARAVGDKPATVNIPIDISGTTAKPSVKPNVKGLAGEAVKNYMGVVQGLFGKKK